jgi:poly(hydroxyalkanoate) granule-associated protein
MGEPTRVIVEQWLSSVASGDVAHAADAVAPDARLHGIGADITGRAAVGFVLGLLKNAFPELRLTSEVLAENGPLAVVRFEANGTQRAELFGLPPGETREVSGICCFSVGAEGIDTMWVYVDPGKLMAQFGLQVGQAAPAGAATPQGAESWRDRMAGSAREIWLAGLGALVAAGEQGERLFSGLIEQGRKLEAASRESAPQSEPAEAATAGITERAKRVASTGQEYFRDFATNLRGRIDLPSRDEFEALRRKVDELLARVGPAAAPAETTGRNAGEQTH